ncbi:MULTISPECIES: long-chain fatty acid--CoA ligase [unclassified Pseudofrankia]|uniref:AMP-dependent synthetase/ligase n=1 Tax=unclassified Pseudofrankia TaxID=2994372 RepID=UPI0008D8F4FF|nr:MULTISPECIES: long-chain fatty acid--CoA ligase [unclassified Pseudofrankia]MDT3445949.1 long-chain fatty acid--CoA ligase [Pseudofrankia sp. BMG5.37]OHV57252.1 long-chain fatty acid--CoA ligase [Pseudofrankia sp. BMG5.36]
MPEFTSPALVTLPDDVTLTDGVFELVRDRPDQVVIRHKVDGEFVDMTYRDFFDRVMATAGGLVAHGVGPGDRVALMSRTRYEWTVLDYAIWMAGAVTVPVYETSSAEQIEWIVTDAEVTLAVVETPRLAELVAEVRDRTPALREVLVIDDGALETLRADGAAVTSDQLAAARAGVRSDSLATIIYTSGTTGRPKGCELSHGALLFDVLAAEAHLPELFSKQSDPSTLLFLPLAHAFARLVQNVAVLVGFPLAYSADVSTLVDDLAKSRPSYLLAAPRIFEKVHARARQTAHASGRGRIFDAAEKAAIAYSQALDTPGGPGAGLRLRHALFDRLVYTRLRAVLGGRVRYAVSGSAPLSERLGHFFRGLGVVVLEGYGLTETAPALSANQPGHVKMGTVGRPFGGVTVRVADDGEVLVRGPLLFSGYHANETATKEALDADGFFRTGDLGTLDAEGFLRITGRKKEILVTAGGKNVAPAPLEQRLQTHPLISQAMVIGDRRPFVAALLTLDEEALEPWLTAHGRLASTPPAELVHDQELLADLQGAVDAANTSVSHAEGIKKFAVLPVDFTVESGELTPSLKVRRSAVMDRFADTVTDIYGAPAEK